MITTESRFSESEIVQAAITAAKRNISGMVDMRDIYMVLRNCPSHSKLYRSRYDLVSPKRLVYVIMHNGFRSVGTRSNQRVYAYEFSS